MSFSYLSKALLPLVYPLGLSSVLLLAAILTRKRLLGICALALLLTFASPAVADALLHSLEDRYPDVAIDRLPPAEAIVVLGGTIHIPTPIHRGSGLTEGTDRVLEALRLYRAGKAPLILCSGGNNKQFISGPEGTPEALVMKALLVEWGVPPDAVLVEDRSINTRENALFSFTMLGNRRIRRILLVTSAVHMPRALGAFRKAGFDAIPAPADFRTGWTEADVLSRWLPAASRLSWSDLALKEWIGLCVYRVRGWV